MNILSYFIIRQNGLELVDLLFVNLLWRIVGKIFNSVQICTSICYHKATNRNEKTRGKVVYLKCSLLCVLSFIITVILLVTLTHMPALLENVAHRGESVWRNLSILRRRLIFTPSASLFTGIVYLVQQPLSVGSLVFIYLEPLWTCPGSLIASEDVRCGVPC